MDITLFDLLFCLILVGWNKKLYKLCKKQKKDILNLLQD